MYSLIIVITEYRYFTNNINLKYFLFFHFNDTLCSHQSATPWLIVSSTIMHLQKFDLIHNFCFVTCDLQSLFNYLRIKLSKSIDFTSAFKPKIQTNDQHPVIKIFRGILQLEFQSLPYLYQKQYQSTCMVLE